MTTANPAVPLRGNEYWEALQAQARLEPLFPRFVGITGTAAIFHRKDLKRQYMTHQAAVERLPYGPYMYPWVSAIIGGCVGVMIALGVISGGEESNLASQQQLAQSGAIIQFFIAAGIGGFTLLLSTTPGLFMMYRKWYYTAYAPALVLEHADESARWRVTKMGMTNILRLAFIAQSTKGYFHGSTMEAGINSGRIVLQTTRLLEELTMEDLYHLQPGSGTFTGTSSRETQALVAEAEAAGDMLFNRGRRNKLLTTDNLVVIAAIVGMVLVFFQAQSLYQFKATEADEFVKDRMEQSRVIEQPWHLRDTGA